MQLNEEIKKVANQSREAKAIFSIFANRERGRADTDIKRMTYMLRRSMPVDNTQVARVFKSLEALGLGKIVYGRHGNPNRFVWDYNLTSVGKIGTGTAERLTSLTYRAQPLPKVQDEVVAENKLSLQSSTTKLIIKDGKVTIEATLPKTHDEIEAIVNLIKHLNVA